MRKYTFYASHHGARFTNYLEDYYSSSKASRCIYEVRASSIKQAYYLARQEVWASGPNEPGLLRRHLGGSGPWQSEPRSRTEATR